jgi:hypothetical protein
MYSYFINVYVLKKAINSFERERFCRKCLGLRPISEKIYWTTVKASHFDIKYRHNIDILIYCTQITVQPNVDQSTIEHFSFKYVHVNANLCIHVRFSKQDAHAHAIVNVQWSCQCQFHCHSMSMSVSESPSHRDHLHVS